MAKRKKRKKRKANEVNKNKIIREFYENGAIVSDCNYGKKAVCNKWDLSEAEFDELVMPKDERQWQLFIEYCIEKLNYRKKSKEKVDNKSVYSGNVVRIPSRDVAIEYLRNVFENKVDKIGADIKKEFSEKNYQYEAVYEIATKDRVYYEDVDEFLSDMNEADWEKFLDLNIGRINENLRTFTTTIPDHKEIENYLGKKLLGRDLNDILKIISSQPGVDLVKISNRERLYHKQLEHLLRYATYAKIISKISKQEIKNKIVNLIKKEATAGEWDFVGSDIEIISDKAFNFVRMQGFQNNILNINSGKMTANAGDAAQFLFISRAIMLGYNCSNVDVRSSRYDSVIDYNGIILKIQVKGISADALISFKDRDRGGVGNDSSNRNNVGRLISSVDCDIYVAVDKECGACYIFPIKEFVENKLTIGQRKKGISTDEAEAFFEKWDIIRIVAEKKRIEAGE